MAVDLSKIDIAENRRRMAAGELHYSFTPDLIAARNRCTEACHRLNDSRDTSRRERVRLYRDLIQDTRPLPRVLADPEADENQFNSTDPWLEPPILCDYGTQLRIGPGAFINRNCHFVDTCPITIGARTLFGPNVHIYSGTHPVDPMLRNGINGPEMGGDVEIGEDCWIGGNAIVLPGVKIGRGSTVGAGSVVTKDVEEFTLVAGVPARVLRKIERSGEKGVEEGKKVESDGNAMAEQAKRLEEKGL